MQRGKLSLGRRRLQWKGKEVEYIDIEYGIQSQPAWFWISAQELPSSITWANYLLSMPQFPYLEEKNMEEEKEKEETYTIGQ